jgi:dTDP-4-amino-4,6-dideoxygalactose transaminase
MDILSLTELTYFRGRVALYAILKALGIEKQDEVAIQGFTCIAVPEAVMAAGARPLYIDVESDGVNMKAKDLSDKITSRTRAIVVQHTFGIPADMDGITAVAHKYGIPIIEDCCHTLTSTYKGKRVGTFGIASFYSFEWGKPIVVGIGGSALINNANIKKVALQQYQSYRDPSGVTEMKIEAQYLAFNILFRPSMYWKVRSIFRALSNLGIVEGNYHPLNTGGEISSEFNLKLHRGRKNY